MLPVIWARSILRDSFPMLLTGNIPYPFRFLHFYYIISIFLSKYLFIILIIHINHHCIWIVSAYLYSVNMFLLFLFFPNYMQQLFINKPIGSANIRIAINLYPFTGIIAYTSARFLH